VDSVDRAGIYASAAVDAGISSDSPLVAGLADSVNRAGILASPAVDALFGNGVSQGIHLLFVLYIAFTFSEETSITPMKCPPLKLGVFRFKIEKNLELSATLLYI
jgi:hypothetical protein